MKETLSGQQFLILFAAGLGMSYLTLLAANLQGTLARWAKFPLIGKNLGGILFLGYLSSAGTLFFFQESRFWALLTGVGIFFVIGALQYGIGWKASLGLQFLAIFGLTFLDIKIQFLSGFLVGSEKQIYSLDLLSIPATILWVMVIIKLIELTDFFDGMTLGTVFIILSALIFAFFEQKAPLLFEKEFSVLTLGIVLGMLRFHHHPAKFSLGKGGTLPLGFIVAGMSILGTSKSVAAVGILLPMLGLWLPILVAAFVIGLTYVKGAVGGMPMRNGEFDAEAPIPSHYFKVTPKRIVVFMYLLFFYVNLITLNLIFSAGLHQTVMLMIFGMVILFQIGKMIFLETLPESAEKPLPKPIVEILGVSIDNVSMDSSIRRIERFLDEEGETRIVVTPNSIAVNIAQEDPEFMEIVNSADLKVPDGVGLIWASRFLNDPLVERVPGIDLMKATLSLGEKRGTGFYFLGSKPEIVKRACENLLISYPGLKISGVRDGYFDESDEDAMISEINSSGAEVLFVALGLPKQEKWISRHKSRLKGIKVAMGIGGSFDVLSETISRAPEFMQKTGLEWLWRLIREPWRCHRMISLPIFVAKIFRLKILSHAKIEEPGNGRQETT